MYWACKLSLCSSAHLWISWLPRTGSWKTSFRTWLRRRSQSPIGKLRLQRSYSGKQEQRAVLSTGTLWACRTSIAVLAHNNPPQQIHQHPASLNLNIRTLEVQEDALNTVNFRHNMGITQNKLLGFLFRFSFCFVGQHGLFQVLLLASDICILQNVII